MSKNYVGIYLQIEPPLILQGESEQAFLQSIIKPSNLKSLDNAEADMLVPCRGYKILVHESTNPNSCTDFEELKALFMQNHSRIIAELLGFYRQNKFTTKIGMWRE